MLFEAANRGSRTGLLATAARSATDTHRRVPVFVLTAVLIVGAACTMWPFVAPLVLSLWAAHLSRPLFLRFRRYLGGRGRAAALVTALLVVVAIAPLALAVMTLVPAGKSLLAQLKHAGGGKGILEALVSNDNGGGGGPMGAGGILALAREYGAGASKAIAAIAGASVEAIVGAFVFFAVFHTLLVDSEEWWSWTRDHSPVPPSILDRLAAAFHQAGRGLVVGTGLTALVQGGLAAALYAAFGVPRALLLGMLSVVAALVPMTGPMLVWIPVCAGLALTGEFGKAALLAALCAGVVGTIDNVIRPWLSRRFEVGMPATVVLVAMLGGVVVAGGWGLFLGPLVVRLAGELLAVCRERGWFGRDPAAPLQSNTP
jgi:predicted PurR-regulated permease PerM